MNLTKGLMGKSFDLLCGKPGVMNIYALVRGGNDKI